MAYDPEKQREYKLRYRAKKHLEKYGPGAGDMRGKHGNHVRGAASPLWKGGGRKLSDRGYVLLLIDGRWRPEHRVVMERVLGRPLRRDEDVHHLNEVKTDNRPENLAVIGHGEHTVHHHLGRPNPKKGARGAGHWTQRRARAA